jgi:hypothetical protein
MGLMNRIFGGGTAPAKGASIPFRDSQGPAAQARSRNEPRRDLVQVVLRDTLRKHGIPADWIELRILPAMTRQHKSGLHVQFLVRKADEQLLPYVHALQESFTSNIGRIDRQAGEWLFSVGWQFFGKATRGFSTMGTPWTEEKQDEASDTQPPEEDSEDLASDLQALQVVMSRPAELTELPPASPRPHKTRGRS